MTQLNDNSEIQTELSISIQEEINYRRTRAKELVENEKLTMHHNIGKMIKTDLLKNKDRAGYGDALIKTLSQTVDMSARDLYASLQFYEQNLAISATSPKLTWSHIRVILTLENPKEQQRVIKKITTEKMSVRELTTYITDQKTQQISPASTPEKQAEKPIRLGAPYTYRIIKEDAKTKIDLGFGIKILSPKQDLTENSIIESQKTGTRYTFTYTGTQNNPQYTYKAKLVDIIDGDTLRVNLDLGFDIDYTLKLRLKDVYAPELNTPEGRTEKARIETLLKNCKYIALKTYWRDKYKRYLAHVFYKPNTSNLTEILDKGQLLV